MKNYINAVRNIYQYRNENIIIGLTGRTGAGCSTVASILKTKSFDKLHLQDIKDYDLDKEQYQIKIIHDFLSTGKRWRPFTVIEVSNVILSFALEKGIDVLVNYIKNELVEKQQQETNIVVGNIDQINGIFQKHRKYFEEIGKVSLSTDLNKLDKSALEEFYNFYFTGLSNFKIALKKE